MKLKHTVSPNMQQNKIRLVIDTNIWVSFLIGKTIVSRLNKLLFDKRFEILSSKELYEELKGVQSLILVN